jgi:hypothetical protein
MPVFDCNADVLGYHADEVTLGTDDQDEMRSRRDNGRTRLQTGLERDGHPLPTEQASQGSYAMRTMHQDPQTDYDIDDAAYFESADLRDADGIDLTANSARERVCQALQQDERLKYPAQNKTNCVRQRYPEGYHIDIPVYRIRRQIDWQGNESVVYEHASGDRWVSSDARAVTRWYNDQVGELNSGQADGSQLRRITRLTKKQARSRIDWKKHTTSGITITKLVVNHFVRSDREDEALLLTWKAISAALTVSTRVVHPVMEGQNLADEGDAEVQYFGERLGDALEWLAVLEAEGCNLVQARKAWDKAFGTNYFTQLPSDDDDTGGKKRSPFVQVSSGAAKRDDGERRFG